jgi:hypothetical protein
MESIGDADFKRLGESTGDPLVSIYLPTHRAGEEMKQDPIRYKNLVREAEKQIMASGRRRPDVESLLSPAHALLEDHLFWQHLSDGLAVFAAPGGILRFRVPLRFDEMVVVAGRFHLKPLLPLLSGNGRFLVLALSQNALRLLEATRYSVDEIVLASLPASLSDALQLDTPERQIQFHTGAGEQGGRRGAVFHGHGPGNEQIKPLLEEYFRRIDAPLAEFFGPRGAPLVLAGVDYYFPMYRNVSRYPRLVKEGVAGNPETLSPAELHRRAWPLVEPLFQQAEAAAVDKYRALAGTGRTSTNPLEVIPAAHQGRVETLFVATDRPLWGRFDVGQSTVTVHEESDAGNEDLLDLAAVRTYLARGTVYATPAARLPDGDLLTATYRY